MEAEAALNGGWLNLDISSGSASRAIDVAGLSRQLSGATTTSLAGQPMGMRGGSAEDPAYSPSLLSEVDFVIQQPGSAASSGPSAAAAAPVPCSFIVTVKPQRRTSVVEFHNASNSNGQWTYGQSADSDIEAGIDFSGDGGWRVGATRHIGNSDDATVSRYFSGGEKANNYGRTDFKFVDGHYKPYGIGSTCSGTSIPVGTKKKTPVSWEGGVGTSTAAGSEYIGCDQRPQSDHRTSYPPGSTFSRTSGSAAEIGAAVDIGPIETGATSGYSERVDLFWDSKRGNGIWLCGTNYGVRTAGVIHAQNRP